VANFRTNTDGALGAVVLAVTLGLVGCGGERKDVLGPTTGKVTFQGQPVAAGEVLFDNGQGIARIAPLASDGAFVVESADGFGLPVGTYKVAIQPPRIEHPLGPIKEPPKPQIFPNIPERFRDLKSSGFSAEIKAGKNELSFDMKP
jgi:hypothetical protein